MRWTPPASGLPPTGYKLEGGRLVKDGQPLAFEFLAQTRQQERLMLSYARTLERLGITARIRQVDSSQYWSRLKSFDFDMIQWTWSASLSPGNEQRDFWSSGAADTPGSRNLMGIEDPVVDALVERLIFATDREDLVAATRALDRVLLWNYYLVPQWHRPVVWLAYWNKFGIPDEQPSYIGADIESWWIDPEKEAALAARYGSRN